MSVLSRAMLTALVRLWPDPTAKRTQRFGAAPDTDAYCERYTEEQFMEGVWFGSPLGRAMPSLLGKRVVEIGCGHGGIACYLAAMGARSVLGLDLNADRVRFGRALAKKMGEARSGKALPVNFALMDAMSLGLQAGSVDVVIAANVFEHFTDPRRAMEEAFRVLAPGGVLVVPVFSSIISKHGLHLKHGIKMPWANLLFSEETLVAVMVAEAERRPELKTYYPGVTRDPRSVRELRLHGDLNDITHQGFKALAAQTGFQVQSFVIHGNLPGRLLSRLAPRALDTRLGDVFSTGAGAVLLKPGLP